MQMLNPPQGNLATNQNAKYSNPKFSPGQNQYQKPNPVSPYQLKTLFRPVQDFGMEYDGKRLRKSVMRKTVDYNASIQRIWQRDHRDKRALQPDQCYYPELVTPAFTPENPINAVTTKFVRSATNKMRCPIFCLAWTPEGRRLVTGASSGEFTLWNGDIWMITGDHGGYIKYWQSNMNNVKMFQAHKEAVRGLSFSPTDHKFTTCSDDGTVRIWDFLRCYEERIMRGHGADVKCVDWHPHKGLVASGSKDNQQPIKLWDPKSGQNIATLHAHKSTVMDLSWNQNGNWLITASRDHLLKLFDLRMLREIQIFRGHKKEASSVAWHPVHESLFCSGGSDGALMFWHVGADKEVGAIEQAHDSIIWALAWHPLGHILCSGSNDHTSKFWTRNRPGDKMRDKYNQNNLSGGLLSGDDVDEEPSASIPGMGPDDKLPSEGMNGEMPIPGLDFSSLDEKPHKKVPYAKPIPKSFQQQWNEAPKKALLPRPDQFAEHDHSWGAAEDSGDFHGMVPSRADDIDLGIKDLDLRSEKNWGKRHRFGNEEEDGEENSNPKRHRSKGGGVMKLGPWRGRKDAQASRAAQQHAPRQGLLGERPSESMLLVNITKSDCDLMCNNVGEELRNENGVNESHDCDRVSKRISRWESVSCSGPLLGFDNRNFESNQNLSQTDFERTRDNTGRGRRMRENVFPPGIFNNMDRHNREKAY